MDGGEVVALAEARRFIADAMRAVGTESGNAELLAEVLVEADYRGHYSHGLNRLGKAPKSQSKLAGGRQKLTSRLLCPRAVRGRRVGGELRAAGRAARAQAERCHGLGGRRPRPRPRRGQLQHGSRHQQGALRRRRLGRRQG